MRFWQFGRETWTQRNDRLHFGGDPSRKIVNISSFAATTEAYTRATMGVDLHQKLGGGQNRKIIGSKNLVF